MRLDVALMACPESCMTCMFQFAVSDKTRGRIGSSKYKLNNLIGNTFSPTTVVSVVICSNELVSYDIESEVMPLSITLASTKT